MTTDAGLQQIMAGYAPPGPGPGLQVSGDLAVQVGQLAAELKIDRQRRALFDQKMQQAIRSTPLLAVSQPAGTPATFTSPDWVCKTGFQWAVQRITAKGLGSTDVVWVYRTSASGGQQIADSASVWPLTNTAPGWHPGRTGLMLAVGDGITVQGTTTAQVTVTIDVIVLESWIVPDFIL